MSDNESIKKILRAVLQSSKDGISLHKLQSEYRSLCGEIIPVKKLGFSNLEDYLRSISSVVRLDYSMGEVRCFATVCKETAHIAELVARQKTAKKSGPSQVVNCRMRFKPPNPYRLYVKSRYPLRQPSSGSDSHTQANHSGFHGGYRGFSAPGNYSMFAPGNICSPDLNPIENLWSIVKKKRCPVFGLYDVAQVQSNISRLLKKYTSGLWMSKLSTKYSEEFGQELHPQALTNLEKWTHLCTVEQPCCFNQADWLIYPPLPPKTTTKAYPVSQIDSITPVSSYSSKTEEPSAPQPLSSVTDPRKFPNGSVAKTAFSSSFIAKNVQNFGRAPFNNTEHTRFSGSVRAVSSSTDTFVVAPYQPSRLGILPLLKITVFPNSDPDPCPPVKSDAVVSTEVRQKIKGLLSKYSYGLWVSALPRVFMDTYKVPFPEHILDNLSCLLDICSVEYPLAHDKKKAILYPSIRGDMDSPTKYESSALPSGLKIVGPVVPPSLAFPRDQYPSVLVTEIKCTNAVTIRYVGENYSNAQEVMEEWMHSYYTQNSMQHCVTDPIVGQLVAVRSDDLDELARGQVMEVISPNKVKVYYMDYGFSVETSMTNLFELQKDFLSLPFQATNVGLAGLEAFVYHSLVLSCLDELAIGKILLMETLENSQQNDMPVVVLYDTSQDEDVNINFTCLTALQDKTMNNPLRVNATYQDVCVTNVCADGILYCQLPSRGTVRMKKLLEETEAYFISQMTSESLVSRPFNGKFCLARHKGNWARATITVVYGTTVLEVFFTDLGLSATVEVTDLREIPPLLLKDFTFIPPQAVKCRLADIAVPEGGWSPEAILWLKEVVLGSKMCTMKIVKLDKHKGDVLVYMYLFNSSDSQELHNSINHQLAQSEFWQKVSGPNNIITCCNLNTDLTMKALIQPSPTTGDNLATYVDKQTLPLPPPLEIPQPGESMDVFVPVAAHPGHFVLQPWKNLSKLMVLIGEMVRYYNKTENASTAPSFQKGNICAAKIDQSWHRVLVKGILANGLVSVYDLDHGKHEVVKSALIQPLIEEFRQLPFQAVATQLAGVTHQQWSEEACERFRKYVEGRALVAQVVSVEDVSEGENWDCRLVVYLVDTSDDKDLWIHSLMEDINHDSDQ
ncbi:tudor domain-containing protein 7A-like [Pholidichthys leucotaenia]